MLHLLSHYYQRKYKKGLVVGMMTDKPVQRNSTPFILDQPVCDWADLIIVGNGIAGMTAALEMRALAPQKRVLVITNQTYPTIHTPALKNFITGKVMQDQLLAYPMESVLTHEITLLHGHMEQIDVKKRLLKLADGQGIYAYEHLLLATGTKAKSLPASLPGYNLDGVVTLHRLPNYLDLHRRLKEVETAVVIGGGVQAAETVRGLTQRRIKVHWLLRKASFLPDMLDTQASTLLLNFMRNTGASIHLNTEVAGIVGKIGTVVGVVTQQQHYIPCQLVVVCIGTMAQTEVAEHSGLFVRPEKGILVNDSLSTSALGVFAAGDVAAIKDTITGVYAPRAQWYDALLQGRTIALEITGHKMSISSSLGVPWQATNLGNFSIVSIGRTKQENSRQKTITNSVGGTYYQLQVEDNYRLTGYLALSPTPANTLGIKRLIDEEHDIREVQHDLLRGTFHADNYFHQKEDFLAQHISQEALRVAWGPSRKRKPETEPLDRRHLDEETMNLSMQRVPAYQVERRDT